jgi:excisionase family DNA binding protein
MLLPLLTAEQVAEHLGVKPKTVHQLVREGKLACIQVTARDRKFTETQIEAFIASRTIHMPKIVDRNSPHKLPSPTRKGGVQRKSTGDSLSERRKMKEDLRSWR